MWLACSVALATTIYKWVDEDGIVHYSDQPHPNAQKVQLQSAQTYRSSEAGAGQGGGPPAPPPPASPAAYQGCAIAQPANDQTLANVDSLTILVRTDPALHAGDQVFLVLDGQALNRGAPTGSQFLLSPVDRGTHTLQAIVRNSDGGFMCQTPEVTFIVHQSSVLGPANPQRKH
jgi:hypothetical protein